MRQTCVFGGSSHPALTDAICERLGRKPDKVELRKFANGETSVEISMANQICLSGKADASVQKPLSATRMSSSSRVAAASRGTRHLVGLR